MAEDKGFEVKDRRRVKTESDPSAEAPEAVDEVVAEPLDADDDANFDFGEDDASDGGPLPSFKVSDYLQMSIGMLAQKAWVGMGLAPDPATGSVAADLSEARLAIAVIGDLVKHLEPQLAGPEKRELQNLVQDLRLNFVRQSQQAGS